MRKLEAIEEKRSFLEKKHRLEKKEISLQSQRGRDHFGEIFRQEHRYIYNLMLQLTGNQALADDLAQETFVKAFEKLSDFRRSSTFRTWLTRIAINLFKNERRKSSNHSSLILEKIPRPESDHSPEQFIIKRELQWCIRHNLRFHVPKKYREVLVLRDLHNFTYKEISEILDLPVSLIKIRLHRARKLFRDQFIKGRCRAYTDDYLCICEGILDLCQPSVRTKNSDG